MPYPIIVMQVAIEGNFVDVVTGEIYPARVTFADGKIVAVERTEICPDQFILPGFLDAHIHVESSQMCPSRFAEAAVVHGTTGIVCDPHEIANVLGMQGIQYMLDDARGVPLRFHFTAPSCVPATSYETNGASLGTEVIDRLLGMKEFVALGEVMDYPAVLLDDPVIQGKIKAARSYWKPVDGHCPGLTGKDLVKYINAGMNTDHECISNDEAEEKFHLGMWIMVREGSGHKNLRDLLPFVKHNECFLVSDDLQAIDLNQGHMDALLRKAVLMGVDPVHAIRAVTAWPSWHYFLPTGVLGPGKVADIVVVDDLREFRVRQVYIAGVLVAQDGKALFVPNPLRIEGGMMVQNRKPEEFKIPYHGDKARVRAIRVMADQVESEEDEAELKVEDGHIRPDLSKDLLLMTVVNRYHAAKVALAFVRGFKLKQGAIASTVAHDSHNIIGVGVDEVCLARAVNQVSLTGGYYVTDGTKEVRLELDVAGLMSTRPCAEVIAREMELLDLVREMGCDLPAPFTTLSFQSLLVVPELKLSDKGLFDSRRMAFVDLLK
jgi:adenine deaminase